MGVHRVDVIPDGVVITFCDCDEKKCDDCCCGDDYVCPECDPQSDKYKYTEKPFDTGKVYIHVRKPTDPEPNLNKK